MFISPFCKICELITEHWTWKCFSFDFCRFSRWCNTGVISVSQMGWQLLQNIEIIKQTDVSLWKILWKYGSVSYSFSCISVFFFFWSEFTIRIVFSLVTLRSLTNGHSAEWSPFIFFDKINLILFHKLETPWPNWH